MTPHRSTARSVEDPRSRSIKEGGDQVPWQLRTADAEDCRRLVDELRIHPVAARVLVSRGWNTPASAARFLDPSWGEILDPAQLPDLDHAIARTAQAIHERITIIGDCGALT